MKAIILAGGRGTRLQSVLHDIPKPMAPVNGRPFLEFLVSRLVNQGIDEIILSVGYLHEQISDHFGNGERFQSSIRYSVEKEPLGTGGAIRKALLMADSDDILVTNGDTFVALDIRELLAFHRSSPYATGTMAVIPLEDASRYGTVEISSTGRVLSFAEKACSRSTLINAGVYVFNRKITDLIKEGNTSLEVDVLPLLAATGCLAAHMQNVPFIDIGVPSAYREFCLNSSAYING